MKSAIDKVADDMATRLAAQEVAIHDRLAGQAALVMEELAARLMARTPTPPATQAATGSGESEDVEGGDLGAGIDVGEQAVGKEGSDANDDGVTNSEEPEASGSTPAVDAPAETRMPAGGETMTPNHLRHGA